MFVTFEGIDGSGKSTQASLVYEFFLNKKYNVFLTKEPGGTALAESVRNLILNSGSMNFDPMAELLLYNAARYDHFINCIKVLLDANYLVICDRFIDSTVAYQGYGLGIDIELIYKIHALVLEGYMPDLTIILDVNLTDSLKRTSGRYEDKGADFMAKVYDGYFKIVEADVANRIHVIDANRDVMSINRQVIDVIDMAISQKTSIKGMRNFIFRKIYFV